MSSLAPARAGPGRGPSPSLLLLSRHRLVAGALGSLLESPPLGATVLVAEDASVAAARGSGFDAAVVDVARPGDGPALIGELREALPLVPLLAIVEAEAPAVLARIFESGANGLLTSDAAAPELATAVAAVMAGGVFLDRRIPQAGRRAGRPAIGPQLSASEVEILRMLGQALSTEAIAQARGTSLKTVRNHIASIYRKLRIRSRSEAVRRAASLGLVTA